MMNQDTAASLDETSKGYFADASATLGDRIAAARSSVGLTQAGLAARLGVGAKVVSGWENDRSEPRANRLAMLSGLLGVSVAWLLTGAGDGVPEPDAASVAVASAAGVKLRVAAAAGDETMRFFSETVGAATERTSAGELAIQVFGLDLTIAPGEDAPAGAFRIELQTPWAEWRPLVDRLRAAGATFETEPSIGDVGAPGETALAAVVAPGGIVLAFAAMRGADAQ